MLKAYAIALALTTAAPVATQSVESAKAPEAAKTTTTSVENKAIKVGSVRF
ncbi:hypothetical protein [Paraglaciecola chathamensis]|jgi:hypothetical protein|uniref:Uncharacterized protein n=3 Tax=Paraglaciecola chathamensis TaxID=368405 RepID=A0A8H9I924_9ALTE|nr:MULTISPECIES: hypothetical protein [Paraglaciecola]MBJ2136175.1 hypothetical protein [Paraglaciecola chathamensis]GAC04318.1 hypothetical protein GAGA_1461 [Paraglaciecola agarilytica NO2]GAC08061.1 hypothetical protein GCHA_0095 [Paraglaciecola chathamensis S18K6]GGZ60620.1 hypothetical protein GCM10011274_18520 [Paraglaciecola oceanifecundans]